MSKEFLDLYAELIEVKRKEVAIKNELFAKTEEVKAKHEHEWFIIEKNIYYCPICEEHKYTNKPIKESKLDFCWIELYKAILEKDTYRADKEIETLRKMGIAYVCDLMAFSDMIKKYGYRLNVDTNKIEKIE